MEVQPPTLEDRSSLQNTSVIEVDGTEYRRQEQEGGDDRPHPLEEREAVHHLEEGQTQHLMDGEGTFTLEGEQYVTVIQDGQVDGGGGSVLF